MKTKYTSIERAIAQKLYKAYEGIRSTKWDKLKAYEQASWLRLARIAIDDILERLKS